MNKLPPYIEPVALSHAEITTITGFENISEEKANELAQTLAIFTEIVHKVEIYRQKTEQTLLGENKVLTLNTKPLKSEAA